MSKTLFITSADLREWLKSLSARYDVFVPVKKDDRLLSDVAVPTVVTPPRKQDPDVAFYRPKIISGTAKQEQVARLSQPHDALTTIQLFLHRNGESRDPQVHHFSRERLCRNSNTIQSELSRHVPDDCETSTGNVCRVFLQNGW